MNLKRKPNLRKIINATRKLILCDAFKLCAMVLFYDKNSFYLTKCI